MRVKRCIDCKEELVIRKFNKRPNYLGTKTIYYQSACAKCMVKRSNSWIKNNREKYQIYQNKYHKTND